MSDTRAAEKHLLSRRRFLVVLSDFEIALDKSLDTLLALKDGHPTASLQRFQPLLYDALLRLSRSYHQIAAERRRLIQNKDALSPRWFAQRQGELAGRQRVLMRATRMGQSVGDAFVWFFYRNNPSLLAEHLKQPPLSLPPPGDGGEGELALVDAVRFFGGRYILFHGITTMFRLGDATLVDLQTGRIDGVGELKTKRIGPTLLSMHFVASVRPDVKFVEPPDGTPVPAAAKFPPKQRAQLDRQLARIAKAAAAAETQPARRVEMVVDEQAHIAEVNDAVKSVRRGGSIVRQLSSGLALLAYAPPTRTLRARLTDTRPLPPAVLERIPEIARSLMTEPLTENILIISSVFYGEDGAPIVIGGATPMLMWPLDSDVQRALATGAVALTTLFNPAHLFSKLHDRGWSKGVFDPPAQYSLKHNWGGKTVELHRVEYFLRLVSHSLYREDYICRLICETIEHIDEIHGDGPMNLDYIHHT